MLESRRSKQELVSYLSTQPEMIKLAEIQGDNIYTTREMLELEKKIFQSVETAQGDRLHTVDANLLSNILREFGTIRAEQSAAVRYMATDSFPCRLC